MNKILKGCVGLTFVSMFVVGLIFAPFLLIWSMNTLFSLGIVYTFKTYVAMVVFNIFVLGGLNSVAQAVNK